LKGDPPIGLADEQPGEEPVIGELTLEVSEVDVLVAERGVCGADQ
jgi:hypothetical protein